MYGEIIIAFVIILVVSLALYYVIRTRKKGAKCIGCPYAEGCGDCNCKNKKEK